MPLTHKVNGSKSSGFSVKINQIRKHEGLKEYLNLKKKKKSGKYPTDGTSEIKLLS